MAVLAFVVSVLALCVSIASFTWQVTTHFLIGPRVKVRGSYLYQAAVAGLPQCYGVSARNIGRQAATVVGVGIDIGGGRYIPLGMLLESALSARLPARLEPYSEATWAIDLNRLRSAKADEPQGAERRWRPMAQLATGETVYGKRGIRLD